MTLRARIRVCFNGRIMQEAWTMGKRVIAQSGLLGLGPQPGAENPGSRTFFVYAFSRIPFCFTFADTPDWISLIWIIRASCVSPCDVFFIISMLLTTFFTKGADHYLELVTSIVYVTNTKTV